MKSPPIFQYVNLKLASRCNIKCTYCYWFRDRTVYDKPPIMSLETERAFIKKLQEHITKYSLDSFTILFHGGEPLLFGKERFVGLMDEIDIIKQKTNCKFKLLMTTNGILIDEEWAKLLRIFSVNVTVSIDGPAKTHDKFRLDFLGSGTHDMVMRGFNLLRKEGHTPGVLAVCDPTGDPEEITEYFANTLHLNHFDLLVPDATHDDQDRKSISTYYKKLFDLWYDKYGPRGIEIRFPKGMLIALLGGDSHIESIGYGPIETLIMLTDGTLEPLDVLRIAGDGSTRTNINITTHTFQDVTKDPIWLRAFLASQDLCDECKKCEYFNACGGGYLPHRWSKKNGFNNVNVYCNDFKEIFGHIGNRVIPEISVKTTNASIPLIQILEEMKETTCDWKNK